MNDYEAMFKFKVDRDQSLRRMRNALLAQELREIEKAQPRRLRFHLHLRLPRFSGLRLNLRRQPNCPQAQTPLNAAH